MSDHVILSSHLLPVAAPVDAPDFLFNEVERGRLERNVNVVV